MKDKGETPKETNNFIVAITSLRKGATLNELSTKLADLADRVRTLGKRGSLTLKLELLPESEVDDCRIKVIATVDGKMPKPDAKATVLFVGDGGQLMLNHPKQTELTKVVEGAEGEHTDKK